jgi:large subunit ribosomal protein L9
MAIEVILKEHVEHLGRRGEVVKVANGYARNFLFPRKLALAVSAENKKQIERERADRSPARPRNSSRAGARRQHRAIELSIGRRVGEGRVMRVGDDLGHRRRARRTGYDRSPQAAAGRSAEDLGDHVVPVKLYWASSPSSRSRSFPRPNRCRNTKLEWHEGFGKPKIIFMPSFFM